MLLDPICRLLLPTLFYRPEKLKNPVKTQWTQPNAIYQAPRTNAPAQMHGLYFSTPSNCKYFICLSQLLFYLNSLSHGHQWPNFLSFLERPSLKKARPGPKNRVRDDHQHQQALIPVEIDEALEQVSFSPFKLKKAILLSGIRQLGVSR